MNLRKNRRLNPQTGVVIAQYLFYGILAASTFGYCWSQLAMTRMQRRCFPLYMETSIPLVKKVSRNGIRRALGDAVDPSDKSRVDKQATYDTLHDLIYKGKSLTEVAKGPAEISGGILFAFLIVGAVQANRQRRALENGIILRGPELMSIRQFNKAARGKVGIELHAHEVIES